MMSEKRLDAIKSEKKNVTKKQEDLYQRQRTCERLNDGIGSYFRKNQRLMQKTRELFARMMTVEFSMKFMLYLHEIQGKR